MLNLNPADDLSFPMFYADLVLSLIRARQRDITPYLVQFGLTPDDLSDPNQSLSVQQCRVMLDVCLAQMIPGEPPFLQLLAHLPTTALGLVGLASMTAATLGEALDIGIQYIALLQPGYVLQRENIHDQVQVVIQTRYAFGSPFDELMVELVVASFARMIDFVKQPAMQQGRSGLRGMAVQFKHHRTEDLAAYQQFFGRPVQFGSAYNAFTMSREFLNVPLLTHNLRTHERLRATLDRQLHHVPQSLTQRVKRLLMQGLVGGQPLDASAVAAQLAMTPRTLSRHLHEEGALLLDLIKQVKMTRAEWLLHSTPLPLPKIAEQLGFSGQAAFTRAYKQETGRTPGEVRKSPNPAADHGINV